MEQKYLQQALKSPEKFGEGKLLELVDLLIKEAEHHLNTSGSVVMMNKMQSLWELESEVANLNAIWSKYELFGELPTLVGSVDAALTLLHGADFLGWRNNEGVLQLSAPYQLGAKDKPWLLSKQNLLRIFAEVGLELHAVPDSHLGRTYIDVEDLPILIDYLQGNAEGLREAQAKGAKNRALLVDEAPESELITFGHCVNALDLLEAYLKLCPQSDFSLLTRFIGVMHLMSLCRNFGTVKLRLSEELSHNFAANNILPEELSWEEFKQRFDPLVVKSLLAFDRLYE